MPVVSSNCCCSVSFPCFVTYLLILILFGDFVRTPLRHLFLACLLFRGLSEFVGPSTGGGRHTSAMSDSCAHGAVGHGCTRRLIATPSSLDVISACLGAHWASKPTARSGDDSWRVCTANKDDGRTNERALLRV